MAPGEVITSTCSKCGRTIANDPRFVTWCEYCDWNLNPGAARLTDKQRRKRQSAGLRARRLFDELATEGLERPTLTWSLVATLAIAVLILLVCAVIPVALGVYLLALGVHEPVFLAIAAIPLAIAWLLRPDLGRVSADAVTVGRSAAPATYALLDRVASAINARPVEMVIVDADFNASYRRAGLRRQEVLTLGVPLWIALNDQERIALLGHELAHQVNGDLSYGLVVGSALQTLNRWQQILDYRGFRRPYRSRTDTAELFVRGVMAMLGKAVLAVLLLERSLMYGVQQRAEYFADRLAADVGSTEAAVDLTDKLHLARPCMRRIGSIVPRDESTPWIVAQQYLAEVSPKEWERLRRIDAQAGQAIDVTHPATTLRCELLKRHPAATPLVVSSSAEQASIEAELADAFERAGAQLLERLRSQAQR